jgi:hypothetical protein
MDHKIIPIHKDEPPFIPVEQRLSIVCTIPLSLQYLLAMFGATVIVYPEQEPETTSGEYRNDQITGYVRSSGMRP